VNYLVVSTLLRHQYPVFAHIWLSSLNRASKMCVGLGPDSDVKMRPVYNSGSKHTRQTTRFERRSQRNASATSIQAQGFLPTDTNAAYGTAPLWGPLKPPFDI